MSKVKKLQRQLDRANKGTGNTTEATDSREEIVDVLGKKGGKLYDKINPPKKSSYQPIKDKSGKVILTSEQARNIDEDFPSPLNHCESDMMHQGGWAKMRTINSPGTTGNKQGIEHNKKMRGFKLPHQSPLKKKGEKDACYHKVKSRVKVWPSAYASGQLVQCRKAGAANWGEKSKKK